MMSMSDILWIVGITTNMCAFSVYPFDFHHRKDCKVSFNPVAVYPRNCIPKTA